MTTGKTSTGRRIDVQSSPDVITDETTTGRRTDILNSADGTTEIKVEFLVVELQT